MFESEQHAIILARLDDPDLEDYLDAYFDDFQLRAFKLAAERLISHANNILYQRERRRVFDRAENES